MRQRKHLEALDQDISDHIERETQDNVDRGMDPKEARYAALRKFGNVARVKEEARNVWKWTWLEQLRQDLRYAIRMLLKSPAFTTVAVLTLGLGIGANTAIFSVVNSVLLVNLPVRDPQQLVFLTNPDSQGGSIGFQEGDREFLTYAEFQSLAGNNQVFSGLLASAFTSEIPIDVPGRDGSGKRADAVPAQVSLVSGSYFSVLGVDPVLGRTFGVEVDGLRDANPVAVISYSFWQGRFAGDPGVVGRKIRIHDGSYEVIGVTPSQYRGETVGAETDVWVPLTMQREVLPGHDYLTQETQPFHKTEWLQVIGRLNPGVSLAQADAAANVAFQQILREQTAGMPASDVQKFLKQHLAVTEGAHGASTLRGSFAKPLQILMGLVGLILLIACANVANLLLARSEARGKEMALRVALGARASRLLRQMLTESLVLVLLGAACGLLLAHWADTALLRMVSAGSSTLPIDVQPDARVLAFTLGISLLVGIVFGLAPAFRTFRVDVNHALKSRSRNAAGLSAPSRIPAGKTVVIAQVALSLLLLIVAGLFVRSFRNLAETQLGFNRDRLLMVPLNPLSFGYDRDRILPLYRQVLDRLKNIPGVAGVTLSLNALFRGMDNGSIVVPAGEKPTLDDHWEARWDFVGPDFFSTAGIPILSGRGITFQDSAGGQRVGVINQFMAERYFGKADPIGKRMIVQTTSEQADFVIVGVAANSKHGSVRESVEPRFYVPFFNAFGDGWATHATLLIRAAVDTAAISSSIRMALKDVAPNLPTADIQTADQLVGGSLASDNTLMQLSTAFGALAVVLVCVGLYGIMAYSVSGRTNEIGIRMALGAQQTNILWLVMRESFLLILIGVAVGLPAVLAVRKWIASLLFGVRPADPLTLAAATVLLFLVGIFACSVPALRAARVDPNIALRYE